MPESGFHTHGLLVSTLGYHITLLRIPRVASSMSDAPEHVKGSSGESREATELRFSPGLPGYLLRLPRDVVRHRAAEIESQMNTHFQMAYSTRLT